MIRTVRGAVKAIDAGNAVIRLDSDETYKFPGKPPAPGEVAAPPPPPENGAEMPDWIALGQHVALTYDDEKGKRDIIQIGKA